MARQVILAPKLLLVMTRLNARERIGLKKEIVMPIYVIQSVV